MPFRAVYFFHFVPFRRGRVFPRPRRDCTETHLDPTDPVTPLCLDNNGLPVLSLAVCTPSCAARPAPSGPGRAAASPSAARPPLPLRQRTLRIFRFSGPIRGTREQGEI